MDGLEHDLLRTVPIEPESSSAGPFARETRSGSSFDEPLVHDEWRVPSRMGRYVILRKLDQGGMGVVLAAYDEQLDRRVAIKVLFPSRTPHAGRASQYKQLEREAQALARLAHPNVVSVFEVGEDEGCVYMAMELVQGEQLGRAAARAREAQGWRGVLELFVQAGRGLAAAHDAGLVHRDFKPANAIVDEHGRVRVLDFGLARVFDPELASRSGREGNETQAPRTDDALSTANRGVVPTVAGVVMGTPAYMSPEQHEGRPLDARSDQFSFCAALYEGLHGNRPYAGATAKELFAKVLAGVPDPPQLATRVPAWLRRIVLRGLHPDPKQRWPSMHELLGALTRGMHRRRPWAFGVAGLAMLAAALVHARVVAPAAPCEAASEALGDVWGSDQRGGLREAIEASSRPGAATTWASVERTLDRYVADWTSGYVEACEAHRRGEQSASLYDRRVVCLEGRRDALAALVDVLSRGDAAAIEHAVPMTLRLPGIEGCADSEGLMAQVELPESPAARAQIVELRRQLSRARALEQSERYEEGLAVVDDVMMRAQGLDHAPLLAEVLSRRGSLLEHRGDYAASEEALTEGFLAALRGGANEQAVESARMMTFLLATRHGRHDDATHWGRLARALLDRGPLPPRVVAAYHATMGSMYQAVDRYDKAQLELEAALEIYERIHPPDHPDIAIVIADIGSVLQATGDYAGARERFERALQMKERLLGPDSAAAADGAIALAYLASDQRDFAEARRLLARARAITLAVFGPEHPQLAYVEKGLGNAAMDEGDLDTAETHYQAALDLRRKLDGHEHPLTLDMESELANIEIETGRFQSAKERLQRVVRVYRANFAAGHLQLTFALFRLARLQRLEGDLRGATDTLSDALTVANANERPDPNVVGVVLLRLGQLARLRDEPERAARLLDDADAELDRAEPEWAASMKIVLATERAELLLATGEASAARALVEPLEARLAKPLDPDDRADLRMVLARARVELGPIDDETRRLVSLAIEDLRAGHLPERAEAATQWLARAER